jgi:hypothetical protein
MDPGVIFKSTHHLPCTNNIICSFSRISTLHPYPSKQSKQCIALLRLCYYHHSMYLYLVSIFRMLVDACVLSPVKMFGKSQLLDFFCEGEWARRYPWVRVSPEIYQFTNFLSQNHTHTLPPTSPLPLNQQPKSGHKTRTPINQSINRAIPFQCHHPSSGYNITWHHKLTHDSFSFKGHSSLQPTFCFGYFLVCGGWRW